MTDFNVRSDTVDVDEIMRQIRSRIREKRGVDYTEEEIRQLAAVKLERFLDPRAVRSDLVEHYRQVQPDNYAFEDSTLYESHRGLIRFFRRLLNPLLKLFFNPNTIAHVLHRQGHINTFLMKHDTLNYELLNNLVVELTRLSIETKNLKMRLESFDTRLDFFERRSRALEDVVQYKPGALAPGVTLGKEDGDEDGDEAADPNQRVRRRRRRRGRRPPTEPGSQNQPGTQGDAPAGTQRASDGGASAGGRASAPSNRPDGGPATSPPAPASPAPRDGGSNES